MKHATIVYYSNDGGIDAVFVGSINQSNLQKTFDSHDIHAIKCITIENEPFSTDRRFNTIYLESDISDFIKEWQIKF